MVKLLLLIAFLVVSLYTNKRLENVRHSLVYVRGMSVNDAVRLVKKGRVLVFLVAGYTLLNILMFLIGILFIVGALL